MLASATLFIATSLASEMEVCVGIGDAVMDCVTHHTPDVLIGERGGCELVSTEDLALLYGSLQGSAWQMCAFNFLQPPPQRVHVDLIPLL